MREDFDTQWHELAEDVLVGMKEWRLQHPKATFCEIEQALDERLSKVRVRMLQDLALASTAADIQAVQEQERPVCAKCGTPLASDGRKVRHLVTQHNQEVTLEWSYGVCPTCGAGFFPPRR
jgi:RNase P subunit RPR2